MPRAGAPKGERETLRLLAAIHTLFFLFFFFLHEALPHCRSTAFCDTASLPTVTGKHLGATVLRITGDESN